MFVLFTRAVVLPAWMALFALIVVLAPPFGATTHILQLLGVALIESALLALMVSTIMAPVPPTCTPHGAAVDVLPSIDVDSWMAVVPATRRVLRIVASAGARFWHVDRIPAAIHGRTRAVSEVRMRASDLCNRSRGRGQASRGLGV